jgi:hypothetical protein
MAVTDWCEPGSLAQTCGALREELGVELALGAALIAQERQQDLSLVLITPEGTTELQRSYGGPPQNGVSWAVHTALDFARRTLIRNRAI